MKPVPQPEGSPPLFEEIRVEVSTPAPVPPGTRCTPPLCLLTAAGAVAGRAGGGRGVQHVALQHDRAAVVAPVLAPRAGRRRAGYHRHERERHGARSCTGAGDGRGQAAAGSHRRVPRAHIGRDAAGHQRGQTSRARERGGGAGRAGASGVGSPRSGAVPADRAAASARRQPLLLRHSGVRDTVWPARRPGPRPALASAPHRRRPAE